MITLLSAATRVACRQMTPQHLNAVAVLDPRPVAAQVSARVNPRYTGGTSQVDGGQ